MTKLLSSRFLSLEEIKRDEMTRGQARRWLAGGAIPSFLYRFSRVDAMSFQETMVRSTLYLASPSSFNDPFDVRAKMVIDGHTPAEQRAALLRAARRAGLKGRRAQARTSEIMAAGTWETSIQASYDRNIQMIGICSLAYRAARNILMWSHYAANHRGVAIQFHTSRCPSVFWRAKPVRYQEDLPHISWVDTDNRGDRLLSAVHCKSPEWAYEREHRLAFVNAAGQPLPIQPAAVAGVILGANAQADDERAVLEACRRRAEAGHPPVRLFRAQLSPNQYRLTIARDRALEARV